MGARHLLRERTRSRTGLFLRIGVPAVLGLLVLLGAMGPLTAQAPEEEEQPGSLRTEVETGLEPSAQTPVESPLDRAYRLVVGDQIQIVVQGHEELSRPYAVPGDGVISFPPAGRIELLNKTTDEVAKQVKEKLLEVKELEGEFEVFVIILAYSPRKAFLIGAVSGVVALPVHTEYRLTQVLSLAGASPLSADFSKVKIIRKVGDGPPFPISLNVEDILYRNEFDKDIVVMPNDTIMIPALLSVVETSYIYVLGKVARPGPVAYNATREKMTLAKLIAHVGDFTQFADETAIVILRKDGNMDRTRKLEVDFDDIIDHKREDFVLQPDDIVFVPERFI